MALDDKRKLQGKLSLDVFFNDHNKNYFGREEGTKAILCWTKE